jgi:alpha,alpha-trehalase
MSGSNNTTPIPGLGRRPSNPFTRRQDERDMAENSSPPTGSFPSSSSFIARFRNASIGSNGSDTIEEQDDEDMEPVPFRAPLGSAKGAGTGVFEAASSAPKSADVPDGLPFKPTLRPAGGSQRQVAIDGLEDPDKLYSKTDAESGLHGGGNARRSSDAAKQRPSAMGTGSGPGTGTGRSRGLIRTYSMAQQKRRPAIMNDDRIIRQRRLSHGERRGHGSIAASS